MSLAPTLELGWWNGWLLLAAFFAVFGVLLLLFPRSIVARLYDISGWSRQQRLMSLAGKPFSLGFIVLAIFTPLQLGQAVCYVGLAVYLAGFAIMIVALFNYRATPLDEPVTRGLYRYSRNPQWLALMLMFVGTGVAMGSWLALLLLAISAIFYHFRLLGEERACLQQYGEPYAAYLERVPRYVSLAPFVARAEAQPDERSLERP